MKLCMVLKKKGSLPQDEIKMEMFRKALEFCQLHDVGCFGIWFT